MTVMRFTIIDEQGTISFVAPWNTLKALVAACSSKPTPTSVESLVEAASKYDSRLRDYIFNGLSVFDEHYSQNNESDEQLNPTLEAELHAILNVPVPTITRNNSEEAELEAWPQSDDESPPEISFEALQAYQQRLNRNALPSHPVLRVIDATTRNQSLEPIKAGLVIFNLPARRIVQVQNSFGVLQRSDRGRYFENGQPTDRLYFYRLPSDWSMVP